MNRAKGPLHISPAQRAGTVMAFRDDRANGPLRFDVRRRESIERFSPRKTGCGGSRCYAD